MDKEITPGKPFITFDDVTLNVNGKHLFEHTNWKFETGQHWAIIGPNGSVKSILANAIFRKIAIVHGQIFYFFEPENPDGTNGLPFFNRGEIVMVSPEAQKELMQQYGGYHQARWQSFEGTDAPTVSYLLSGKSIEHRSPYEVTPFKVNEQVYLERREKAVTLLEIEYLLDRKIIHLSNGESRKVLIALALMQFPKLLILDDPFGGLDNSARSILTRAVTELLAIGESQILLVTSGPEELPAGITHILLVDYNQVVGQGNKEYMLPKLPGPKIFSSEGKFNPNRPLKFPAFMLETMNSGKVLVEMRNISVVYGGVKVLSEITWSVRQGEHWALLGHNGAGKTTLLSMILADNPQAYSNEIRLFGKARGSGESIWEIKRQIGWISPELQIYYRSSDLTCCATVCSGFFDSIGLYQECSEEQAQAANQWMHVLGIAELSDQPFSLVSAGEQRLVLLARALVKNPALLVLDEPCQGLDFQHRKLINDLLDRICEQTPVSLIYVTHYFDEIPQAITHVLKLEHGSILECDQRHQVLPGRVNF